MTSFGPKCPRVFISIAWCSILLYHIVVLYCIAESLLCSDDLSIYVQVPQDWALLHADLGTLEPLCSQSSQRTGLTQQTRLTDHPRSTLLSRNSLTTVSSPGQPAIFYANIKSRSWSQCSDVIGLKSRCKMCSMYCSYSTHIIAPALPARFFVFCF